MRRSSKFGDIAEENEVEKTSNVNNRDSWSAKSPEVEEDKLDATGIAGAMGFTSTDIFMSAAKGHLKKLKSIYKQDPTIIYHRDENVRNNLCLYSNEKKKRKFQTPHPTIGKNSLPIGLLLVDQTSNSF